MLWDRSRVLLLGSRLSLGYQLRADFSNGIRSHNSEVIDGVQDAGKIKGQAKSKAPF